jgi:hypothetical protein
MLKSLKYHLRNAVLPLTILGLLLITIALRDLIPIGDDWRNVFHGVPILNPYIYNDTRQSWAKVSYPPWIMVLLPHAQLEISTGNAINFFLNLIIPMAVIAKLTRSQTSGYGYRKRMYTAIFLTYTSPFYLQLIATNNVDWIPLIAFLVPDISAGLFLVCKPQAIGGALLVFTKRTRGLVLVPIIALVALSFVIWPGWLSEIRMPSLDAVVNIAPFPLMIPLGLYLLWRAWKENNEILAASATPFLVPYLTFSAASTNMVLIASSYQKIAWIVWLCMWTLVGVAVRQALL